MILAPARPRLADRLNQRVFDALYQRSLIYNTCWEDPALDRQAMELNGDHTVVMITSAGCNALDYALDGPQRIHAIDANPRQTALLELKMAAIRHLDFSDMWQIFGEGHHPDFAPLYQARLRPDLSPFAQKFWDHRTRWFSGAGWRNSFYFHGLSGLVARLVRSAVARKPELRKGIESLLATEDILRQRWIYDAKIAPHFWTPRLQWAISRQTTMSLLGVPHAQTSEVARSHDGGVAGFIRASVDRIFREVPMHQNYFWSVYLRGHYTRSNCPNYLTPNGFMALKRGLVDRIQVHTNTISGFLQQLPVASVDRYVLLDHMDWMSHHRPADLGAEWDLIRRTAAPQAQILFRTAHPTADYLWQVTTSDGVAIAAQLRSDVARAQALHGQCRVGTYGGFHMVELK